MSHQKSNQTNMKPKQSYSKYQLQNKYSSEIYNIIIFQDSAGVNNTMLWPKLHIIVNILD